MLVCLDTWRQIPREVRQRVMLPGVMEKDRSAAVYQVVKHAVGICDARRARGAVHGTAGRV